MRRMFIAALLLAGCQTTPVVVEPTPENVAAQFEASAFGDDFGPDRETMRRWGNTPVIAFGRTDQLVAHAKRYEPVLRASLDDIADLTGLGWLPKSESVREANFVIAFLPRGDFRQAEPEWATASDYAYRSSLCMVHTAMYRPTGELVGAMVLIPSDAPEDRQQHCILEEIYQAMGLSADACHYRPSVICEADTVFELTEADKIMLRVLYHPALEAGMSRQQAMPVARRLIREMMAK